jgi:uncharacterized protein
MANLDLPAFNPVPLIAAQLDLPAGSVAATVALLNTGGTVPFIARYRKEATGGLDEVQIRDVQEKQAYLTELEERRRTVLEEIEKQGKLTDELKGRILAVTEKSVLEDLYLPYRPKRRTRATMARERGLEPLALRIMGQGTDGRPEAEAAAFVSADKGVEDVKAALQGARDIVAETCAERAEVRAHARGEMMERGSVVAQKAADVQGPTKFETYYDFKEPCRSVPSHRYLAIRRGEAENVLKLSVEVNEEEVVARALGVMRHAPGSPWAGELEAAVRDAVKRLVLPSMETEVRADLKLRADQEAIDVFAQNLRALLLASPLGAKTVIGMDPGQRTGCKVAVVDDTGKLLDHTVLYLVKGEGALAAARRELLALVEKHRPVAVAIGNGTHGRESEQFVRETLREAAKQGVFPVLVNEAGASVYSASDVAREEFPDLDLTVRGAISIARRLQDPLAELVKVDPKSIGVGQYQHDVHQPFLAKKLDDVVESCVNQVGVDLNTASPSLLRYVAGIGPALAKKIVVRRESTGAYHSREDLRGVSGMGPRTFEQCAGFLRIRSGGHPLDGSAVHPERYGVVERMATDLGVPLGSLVGNALLARQVDWRRYVSDNLGEPTLKDIVDELAKPGRDPRDTFEPPTFRDDVRTMEDLQPGMWLEGVVTNVTAFGAFVDIGVHQDGLCHVSQLADKFVKQPSDVVKAGDKLKVRVIEVDAVRKRISLTARSGELPAKAAVPAAADRGRRDGNRPEPPRKAGPDFSNRPFERLLRK